MSALPIRARAAMVVLVALALAGLGAPLVESALGVAATRPDLALRGCAASWPHLLGCDAIGQDVFTRLLYGARVSLAVGVGAALVSTVLGTLIGSAAGLLGGRVDRALTALIDTMLAIPLLPLLLLVSAMRFGAPSSSSTGAVVKLVVILGLFGWMGVARIARGEARRVAALGFVEAGRALGAGSARLLRVHVVPNALPPILVAAAIDVGRNILAEAALSYLGLGVQPPAASWGNLLRHAQDALHDQPSLALWPGLCVLASVVSIHVLAEAVGRRLGPGAA
ncbi:MAG: ABC transporter permease [Deltaproteobacteria bacterium]|nr:ABC transporter permease [Deltaproteobacteria bacterium]